MGNTSTRPHSRSRHKKQVHWKAADRPAAPGKPQLVAETEITPDVVTIKWDPPRYDGGSPITGYLVEHRRYGSPHWVRATPLLVPFTELSLSGLEPGWRYQFRVSAENAVGLSAPGELSELLTVTLQRSAVSVPRFIDDFDDTVALENEKVEFAVSFVGQPPPKISWFKDGFEIFSSRRIRILTDNEKSILTIHQCALADEGEIKCTATNRAGHVTVRAKLILEAPPSIRLPRQYEDGLLFELGEVIKLKVSIAGQPLPMILWMHNNELIKNDERYEIETTDKYSSVRILQAERTDRGEYQVKAINKLGDAISSFLVTVTDKPSPPGRARVIMTLGRSVTLSWNLPTDDGGCKIGNYIVEYFRMGWDVWLKAATCRQLTTTIGDLIEGSEYKFRIKAESPYGVSEPSEETDLIFIPDPKRGILTPSIRSRSQPRDIFENRPTRAVQRQPRSQSSSRTETLPNRPTTPVQFYEGGIPVRPARTKIKSPSITPEPSPMVTRRNKSVNVINKSIFDRNFMARDMAYGSPEIKFKNQINEIQSNDVEDEIETPYHSETLNRSPKVALKSTVNVLHYQNQDVEDIFRKQLPPSPKPIRRKLTSPNVSREKLRSPSPQTLREESLSPKTSREKLRSPSPKLVREKPRSPETSREKLRSPSPKLIRNKPRSPEISREKLRSPSPKLIREKPMSPETSREKLTSPSLSKRSEENYFSPVFKRKRKSSSPSGRFKERVRSKSPSPIRSSKSRSPSPVKFPKPPHQEENSTKMKYDFNFPKLSRDKQPFSDSSEFMLVLLPEKERGRGSASDIRFDFDDNSAPPPMSLSAPELGAEPLLFEPLRSAVSSTELLHEQAMARFYEALAEEEAKMENKTDNESSQYKNVEVPKIQINSREDQVIVGLERMNSTRRRFSGSASLPQHLLWAQRRHSLKNSSDLADVPENSLRKFPAVLDNKTVQKFSKFDQPKQRSLDSNKQESVGLRKFPVMSADDKRELFSSRQRSESEEKEEEEFERVRAKMAVNEKDKHSYKRVTVAEEDEWEEEEPEESLSESETESSEDELFRDSSNVPSRFFENDNSEEEEIYNPRGRQITKKSKNDEPFEILTKPNPLPDPNFKPKPILKRRNREATPPKPIRKSINTNNIGQRSLSNAKEALYELEDSSSLCPQTDFLEYEEVPDMKKRGSSPSIPYKKRISVIAEIPAMTAASVGMPQPSNAPPVQRKRSEEEIKVVVDHYGDIVRSYGQKKKVIPQVYLNADDLKAAAERQSRENLREIERSFEDLTSEDPSMDDTLEDLSIAIPDDTPKRGLVEASSALLRSVTRRVSAAFAKEDAVDDVISPETEIIPSMQRRGSAQVNLNKRRPSKSLNKLEVPKPQKKSPSKSPTRGENWSNLRAPSPSRQGGKLSPSPARRNSLTPPMHQVRRNSLGAGSHLPTSRPPKTKEITTQTAVGSDDPGDSKKNVLLAAKQEELSAKAEFKVRTTVDYITDLAMFIVACWLYLFQNELLAIPVLAIMVYRQLKEEIKKKLPGWLFGKKKTKRK